CPGRETAPARAARASAALGMAPGRWTPGSFERSGSRSDPVRVPDGFSAPPRRRKQLRILEQLLDEGGRIPGRRLHDVAPLVARDLREDPLRHDRTRLLFR